MSLLVKSRSRVRDGVLPLLVAKPSLEACNHQPEKADCDRNEHTDRCCHQYLPLSAFRATFEQTTEPVTRTRILQLVMQLDQSFAKVGVIDFGIGFPFEPVDLVAEEFFEKSTLLVK